MSDLRINSSGDLDLQSNNVALVTGSDAVRQHWAMRMRTVRGEWVFDERVGVPYLEEVFGKPKLDAVEGIFRRVTLDTPGIAAIESFTLSLDTSTRALTIECVARTEDLETITLVFSDLLMELS